MRITGFDIDGFGIFSKAGVSDLPPGLVVFHGANEAGKSTCLAFVHAVLFGFPDGRTKSQTQYPPLRGGEAGGRLFVSSRQYPEAVIERRPGVRGGPVRVQVGDVAGAGEGLARLLQGVNLTLYRNLYGFSLTELQNLQTLTDDEVKDVIYGASFGGGAQTFSQAVKTLSLKMADLFKPAGRRSEINLLLKEIKTQRDELKEAARDLAAFDQASLNIESLEAEINDRKTQLATQRSLAKRAELFLKLWDTWLGLTVARATLEDLPILEGAFPADGLQRLGDLQTQLATEEKNARKLAQELEGARLKLSQIVYDELIVAATGDIKALVAGLETYENALVDLGRIEDREKAADRLVKDIVSSFGPGWYEERVVAIDRSAPTIDKIERLQMVVEQARNLEEKLKERVSELRGNRTEREVELRRDEKNLEVLGDLGPEIDRQSLEILRERRELYAGVLRDIPNRLADHETTRRDLKDLLKEIDPKWTVEHLDGVDFSITTREQAQELEDGLALARARIETAKAENEHRIEEVDEARISLAALTEKLDELSASEGYEDSGLDRQTLRDLRHLVGRRELAAGELKHRQERWHDVHRPVSILKGLGLGLPLLGVLGFFLCELQGQRAIGALLGAVFFAFAVIFLGSARRRSLQATELKLLVDGVELQIQDFEERVFAIKTACKIEDDVDSEILDEAEDRLAGHLRRNEAEKRVTADFGEKEALLARREKRAENARDELEQARARMAECERAWSLFITGFGLDERTTPRIFERVLTRAARARQMLKEIDSLSDRIAKMDVIRLEYLKVARALPQLENEDPEKLVAVVDRLYAGLLTRHQRSTEIEIAETARKQSEKRYTSAVEQQRSAELDLEAAAVTRCTAEQKWARFLDEHGFDGSWSPATTRDMLSRLEQLSHNLARRNQAASDRRRCREVIEDFEERAGRLFALIDRALPSPGRELASEIRKIVEIQESAVILRSTAQATTEDIEHRQRSLDAGHDEVQRLREDLTALFAEGGAADEVDFRRRAELFAKRASIKSEIAVLESQVRTISGEADLAALEVELKKENKADLQAKCEQFEKDINEADERLGQLMRASAQAGTERDRLASTDRIAELRATEERLIEEIRDRAHQWSRYAIAAHLLDTAKARFEESHQPAVILHATRFFSEITGGRYKKVFAPHEEDHIDVVDAHGQRFSAEVLSRGTQEQLYLAIRFGYIRAREKNSEPLPIIMDDVLVNFDPERAKRAAVAISEMTKTNQVLFFTCHPSTVDIFRAVDRNVAVYELEDGKIRTG